MEVHIDMPRPGVRKRKRRVSYTWAPHSGKRERVRRLKQDLRGAMGLQAQNIVETILKYARSPLIIRGRT